MCRNSANPHSQSLGRIGGAGWCGCWAIRYAPVCVVGIAAETGAWLGKTAAKLRAAGLSLDLNNGASADDAVRRDEIVATAIKRCVAKNGGIGFERIVSVGDGVWDVETAAKLALPFVGVSAEADARSLREAGAKHVIEGFTDVEGTRHFVCQTKIGLTIVQSRRPRSSEIVICRTQWLNVSWMRRVFRGRLDGTRFSSIPAVTDLEQLG